MRAIVFDLDGTLLRFTEGYDEILAGAFRAVAGEARGEWIDAYDEAFYELFGALEPDPVERAFERTGAAPADELAAALRRREVEACEPPDGIRADLERLAGTHALGVLTNGVPEWQAHKLRAFGLGRYFDAVVASYGAGAHKPAAEPYAAVEERLPADAYAMVGDAETDVEGAREAGWAAYRYEGGGFGDLPGAIEWGG